MKLAARIVRLFFSAILVAIFLLLPSLCFLSPSPAYAQTNPYATLVPTESNVPMNISTLTQGVLFGLLSSATCIVGGIDFTSADHKCLAYNNQTGKFGYDTSSGGGILGMEAGGLSMLYTSPFHTSDYINYISSNFGLAKKADAASSSGFEQLSPIVSLWLAFRNLAYLLFVIIFVVIGFAIMLRAKIDPRTVMTIENQLPKLIVALILITFSFAIAGLMIDIMWVLIYLVINLFGSLDPQLAKQIGPMTGAVHDNPFAWVNTINNGPLGFLGIAQQAAGSIKDIANLISKNVFDNAGFLKVLIGGTFGIPFTIGCALQSIVPHIDLGPLHLGGQDFGSCTDAAYATVISSVIGGFTFLIFAFALIAVLAKLWWSLLKAYALFLIYVIFGPIMIMAGVLPGTKVNFENWIRHIAAYLLVFPTAMGIFLLGKTLMDVYATQQGVVPPLLGQDPKVTSLLGPLLGFTVIMLAPQALTMVQDALSAPDIKYLPGAGQAIAAGGGIVTGGFNKAIWDPLFREQNLATGRQAGLVRHALTGGIHDANTPAVIRGLARWFGYRRQSEGYGK